MLVQIFRKSALVSGPLLAAGMMTHKESHFLHRKHSSHQRPAKPPNGSYVPKPPKAGCCGKGKSALERERDKTLAILEAKKKALAKKANNLPSEVQALTGEEHCEKAVQALTSDETFVAFSTGTDAETCVHSAWLGSYNDFCNTDNCALSNADMDAKLARVSLDHPKNALCEEIARMPAACEEMSAKNIHNLNLTTMIDYDGAAGECEYHKLVATWGTFCGIYMDAINDSLSAIHDSLDSYSLKKRDRVWGDARQDAFNRNWFKKEDESWKKAKQECVDEKQGA